MKKVELLAPAGNYESFLGAIHAGADAVYLGGDKFGARAYADNFHTEELCQAISYAHLFGRKVYLTLNTLIKEKEFAEVYDYVKPFYEAGLDGIIVQDIGVFSYIRKQFPLLPLHVSTQMTVTGVHAASLLKSEGAERIVPARELSLKEIRLIKEQTGLELETFIHGAMCYCYSGQCLFSSILGGRSGNRGKCAQPCRLPYEISKDGKPVKYGAKNGEAYPLSLKDMCTIEHIPELIEAGIDSFKIEGRMKKPEYTAGVTAIYRKYIDLYYEKGGKIKVSPEDMQTLNSLYIRSEIQDGYYFRHNGSEMVTHGAPGYSGSDETVLQRVRSRYLEQELKLPVQMHAAFYEGSCAVLTLFHGDISVTVTGNEVQKAMKQPISRENIADGISAVGGTHFELTDLVIDMDNDIFYPLKAIKELRRRGLEELTQAIINAQFPELQKRRETQEICADESLTGKSWKSASQQEIANAPYRLLFTRKEQLDAYLKSGIPVGRLYLDCDLCKNAVDWQNLLKQLRENKQVTQHGTKLFLVLPYILRKRDEKYLQNLFPVLERADGCMVRNMEGYAFLTEQHYQKPICSDAGVYIWNRETYKFWKEKLEGFCLPYELSGREQECLTGNGQWEQVAYGHLPMMVTANCVAKTSGYCPQNSDHKSFSFTLQDRYKKTIPVYTNCMHCYNIIYNSVPLSLHGKLAGAAKQDRYYRLDFTVESFEETQAVMAYFEALRCGDTSCNIPFAEYTTGHEKKGAQ